MTPEEVLGLFRASGALLEGHFELSSGLHSERYFQCARLLEDPRRAGELAGALADQLRAADQAPIELVVGPAIGAVVWAQEMGRALGTHAIFTERSGGEMTLRRGFEVRPGERVLIVEDVVTTGGSAREALDVIRERGAEIVAVGTILNRSGGNPFAGDEGEGGEGLPLFSLAEAQAVAWERDACPLCAAGGQAVKPGSRPGAAAASSAAGGQPA
ncbi:MAG TPA: orotate phosphoribosyltransferase [Planctomycetota bacterium]|nr:orotate phosphoribosyltransferase [Planctomycetota bacterium]